MAKKHHYDDHYFKYIFEHSPTSIQIYSVDGYLRSYNLAFETLFNVDPAPFIGTYNVFEDPQLIESGIIDLIRRVVEGETIENLISRYSPHSLIAARLMPPLKTSICKPYKQETPYR